MALEMLYGDVCEKDVLSESLTSTFVFDLSELDTKETGRFWMLLRGLCPSSRNFLISWVQILVWWVLVADVIGGIGTFRFLIVWALSPLFGDI